MQCIYFTNTESLSNSNKEVLLLNTMHKYSVRQFNIHLNSHPWNNEGFPLDWKKLLCTVGIVFLIILN